MPDLSLSTVPNGACSPTTKKKDRPETFSSMLEMAGGAPPSLPSSHLDPDAFATRSSSSSFPSPTHSQDQGGPPLSRASQGAALPINGATRTGGYVYEQDDDAATAADPFQSQSQSQFSGSSLFSTATASTPIPFSSHPALQPHMPPLHFVSTPDDVASSLGHGWGWGSSGGGAGQGPQLAESQSNGYGSGIAGGSGGGGESFLFDLLGGTVSIEESLPAGLLGYAPPSDPSPASLASASASGSTSRGSTSHGHGQGGGVGTGSRGSDDIDIDIDLVSRDHRTPPPQGEPPLTDIPATAPSALPTASSSSSSSAASATGHRLPLPILASLIRATGGGGGDPPNKSATMLTKKRKKSVAFGGGGAGEAGGGKRGVSHGSGGGGESSSSSGGNGNWGGEGRSRSGSGPVRGFSNGSGGDGQQPPYNDGSGSSGVGGDGQSAGGGKRRRGDEGDDESPVGSGAGAGAGDSKKIVQRADKSCRKCRERRVRCDRLWPACERCHKRRESCEWAEGTNVDEIEEGGDAERIAALQSKVASLERQLKTAAQNARRNSGSGSGSGSGSAAPVEQTSYPPPPSPSSSSNLPRSSRHPAARLPKDPTTTTTVTSLSGFASPPASANESGTLAASIWLTIRDIWALRLDMEPEETETLLRYLAAQSSAPYAGQLNLARSNVHWRLGEPLMAKVLTIHLLDAAVQACCSRLPGIFPLAQKIGEYKNKLDSLTPADECSVAVLAALGARASPHSQLLGIDTVCLADGTPSPPMFLYAGERREMACRQLESRARELCWSHGFFEHVKIEHLDSTVGLVQLLIYEEIMPKQSRFFARSAVGLYFDIRYEDLEQGKRTSQDPRIGSGAALFLADATIAAACSRPSYISTTELDQYVITDGVRVPDFPGTELQTELERILERPVTTEKLVDAMSTVMLWVAGCHRLFAQLTTARRPNAPSTLPLLKSLWKLVDKIHTAVQNLQQFFVGLSVEEVVDLDQDPFALEHYILMGVRYDSLLVDIVNLQHTYLMTSRKSGDWAESEDDPLLLEMREESMLRVRKCLKLTAFYAQLYLQSQDKHLVHHMLMQLEMLPNWSIWATQRVGTPGGPISSEYELTEVELDWLQQALVLSSYYTPKAAQRLELFAKARGKLSEDGPRTIEDLLRQSRGALRRPVAELESQYQNALVQNGTFDPTQQDPTTRSPRVPPTLQHVPVHEEPQRYYNVDDTSFAPSASEIFIFDDYGVASIQGMPLSQQPPVSSLEFVQNGFRSGEHSWMYLPSDFPTAVGNEVAREAKSAEELTDRWLGGQSVGQ